MSKFREMDTRVKINPETYLKFDGSEQVVLQNIYCQEALRIKYDIMLILFDLIDWKSVGDLIAPWPPDDQEKIIESLEKLYEGKLIVLDDAEIQETPESGLAEHLGNKIHINVENHHVMLRDYVRTAAYRRAIERCVKPGMVAMDLGCGTGILSFFAARAGAEKVYAIEKRPDIILMAEELAKRNNLPQVEFIEGASGSIKESMIQPKADVLISEILGNGILEENVLEFTLDARDRFLKPGGQLIPWKLDIYVFAFDSGSKYNKAPEVEEFKDLYGFDFSFFGEILCRKATLSVERFNPALNQVMSEPQRVKSLDFKTLQGTIFTENFELEATHNGEINGFCAYFKAYLDEETTLTNSPWAPPTHWTHLIYCLPAPRSVEKGARLPMELIYDGNLRLKVQD